MKNIILAASGLAVLALAAPAHAGGVALCIETGSNSANNGDDKQYFLRYSPTMDGRALEREAREDFREERDGGNNSPVPACISSDRSIEHGEFVVIQGGRRLDHTDTPYTRWALGFGGNRSAAIREAIRQLRMRDGNYQEDRHGYSVVESGSF